MSIRKNKLVLPCALVLAMLSYDTHATSDCYDIKFGTATAGTSASNCAVASIYGIYHYCTGVCFSDNYSPATYCVPLGSTYADCTDGHAPIIVSSYDGTCGPLSAGCPCTEPTTPSSVHNGSNDEATALFTGLKCGCKP